MDCDTLLTVSTQSHCNNSWQSVMSSLFIIQVLLIFHCLGKWKNFALGLGFDIWFWLTCLWRKLFRYKEGCLESKAQETIWPGSSLKKPLPFPTHEMSSLTLFSCFILTAMIPALPWWGWDIFQNGTNSTASRSHAGICDRYTAPYLQNP